MVPNQHIHVCSFQDFLVEHLVRKSSSVHAHRSWTAHKARGQAFCPPGLHSNMAYLIYLHRCCDSCHALISMTSDLVKAEQHNLRTFQSRSTLNTARGRPCEGNFASLKTHPFFSSSWISFFALNLLAFRKNI